MIYQKVKRDEAYRLKGDIHAFVPAFDSTDHLAFACKKCKEIAEILLVERNNAYAKTPTIYFYLRCPKCGSQGYRKIYLEDRGKHWLVIAKTVEVLAQTTHEARGGIIKVP